MTSTLLEPAASPVWRYDHVRAYLKWVHACRDRLARTGRVWIDWAGVPLDAAGFRREFTDALDRRINAKAGLDRPRGRRDSDDHRRALVQDRADLQARLRSRVRIYQFRTPEFRGRFGHLLCDRDDL